MKLTWYGAIEVAECGIANTLLEGIWYGDGAKYTFGWMLVVVVF
jgi:hypothetical protein